MPCAPAHAAARMYCFRHRRSRFVELGSKPGLIIPVGQHRGGRRRARRPGLRQVGEQVEVVRIGREQCWCRDLQAGAETSGSAENCRGGRRAPAELRGLRYACEPPRSRTPSSASLRRALPRPSRTSTSTASSRAPMAVGSRSGERIQRRSSRDPIGVRVVSSVSRRVVPRAPAAARPARDSGGSFRRPEMAGGAPDHGAPEVKSRRLELVEW
jgi:hypothetical protein